MTTPEFISKTATEIASKPNEGADVPAASTFTSSPLRNRIRVELKAPVSEVWALIGNLTRFPEYSSGLERVEVKKDSSGTSKEYVCHFKPLEEGGERIVSRELIRWYEPNRGYASSGAGGDAFGLTNDLHLATLEPWQEGTLLTWDEYYDAQDLEMMKAHFDHALADIAENLIRRFGGRVVERYVEK
ncbi:MAG: SRPBCC family protein [Nitrososphaera sp.]|nr:SRPBCC family protein [Nitrososphaera sp.]